MSGSGASGPRETDGGRATVFFVDDDAALRDITRRLLSRRGYEVILAASAEQAVELLEGHRGRVDVVLMDVNLPDGWGASVAARLRALRPELPVVYTTGFAEVDPILSGGLNDTTFVIRKPYSSQELVEILEKAMRTTPPSEPDPGAG